MMTRFSCFVRVSGLRIVITIGSNGHDGREKTSATADVHPMVRVFYKIRTAKQNHARPAACAASNNAARGYCISFLPQGVLSTSGCARFTAMLFDAYLTPQSEYIHSLKPCDTARLFCCITMTARPWSFPLHYYGTKHILVNLITLPRLASTSWPVLSHTPGKLFLSILWLSKTGTSSCTWLSALRFSWEAAIMIRQPGGAHLVYIPPQKKLDQAEAPSREVSCWFFQVRYPS